MKLDALGPQPGEQLPVVAAPVEDDGEGSVAEDRPDLLDDGPHRPGEVGGERLGEEQQGSSPLVADEVGHHPRGGHAAEGLDAGSPPRPDEGPELPAAEMLGRLDGALPEHGQKEDRQGHRPHPKALGAGEAEVAPGDVEEADQVDRRPVDGRPQRQAAYRPGKDDRGVEGGGGIVGVPLGDGAARCRRLGRGCVLGRSGAAARLARGGLVSLGGDPLASPRVASPGHPSTASRRVGVGVVLEQAALPPPSADHPTDVVDAHAHAGLRGHQLGDLLRGDPPCLGVDDRLRLVGELARGRGRTQGRQKPRQPLSRHPSGQVADGVSVHAERLGDLDVGGRLDLRERRDGGIPAHLVRSVEDLDEHAPGEDRHLALEAVHHQLRPDGDPLGRGEGEEEGLVVIVVGHDLTLQFGWAKVKDICLGNSLAISSQISP